MGVMVVLNQQGDIQIEWDPADADSTAKARDEYDRLKKDGFEFYEIVDARGKQLKRWDKKVGRLIAAPGARKPADRKAGTRQKAMAGGPVAQSAPLR